jgi:hypothetical protein
MTASMILASLSALAAASSSTPPKSLNGFPAAYVGRWGDEAGGCSPGAIHAGLTIKPKLVVDGEFNGRVTSVVRKPDGSIEVVEVWDTAESDTTKFLSNYSLSKDGKSLTVRTLEPANEYFSEPLKLIRCEAKR